MSDKVKIAIIGFSTLESLGVRSLFHHEQVRVESFSSYCEMETYGLHFDGFVTDATTFAANLEGLLPVKRKTLIFSQRAVESELHTFPRVVGVSIPASRLQQIADDFISGLIIDSEDSSTEISSREREVIKEIAAGKTNKEIAEALCISINTVITHRKNIAAKLGIKSASGISLYALMQGII